MLAGVAVEAVAAEEVSIPVVSGVDVLRDQEPARVAGRLADGGLERRDEPAGPLEREMVHQVVSQHRGGVPHAVGETARSRIQQNARGLERRGREHNHPGARLAVGVRGAFDVVNPRGLPIVVHQQVAHDGIADQCEAACPRRRGERHGGAVEV